MRNTMQPMRLLCLFLFVFPTLISAQSSTKKSAHNARKAAMERAMKARQNKDMGITAEISIQGEGEEESSLEELDALMQAMENVESANAIASTPKENNRATNQVIIGIPKAKEVPKSQIESEARSYKSRNSDSNNKSKPSKANQQTSTSKPAKKKTSTYVDNPSSKGSTMERLEAAELARKAEVARLVDLENNRTTEAIPVYNRSEVAVEDNTHDNGSRAALEREKAEKAAAAVEQKRLAEAKRMEAQNRALQEKTGSEQRAEENRIARTEKEEASKKAETNRLAKAEEVKRQAIVKEERRLEERNQKEQAETQRLERIASERKAEEAKGKREDERIREEKEIAAEQMRLVKAKNAKEEEEKN
ncbi:MAG: hypothetical protein ACJATF_003920, partial [Flavobacteriales bacterium]